MRLRERGGVKEKMYCHLVFLNHICEQTIYLCAKEKEKEIKDKRLKTKKRKEKTQFFLIVLIYQKLQFERRNKLFFQIILN